MIIVEDVIAQWLEDESYGTLGTDIFLTNIFTTDKEGMCVLFNRELGTWSGLDWCYIQILIFKRDYVVGRNLEGGIRDSLNLRRGILDEDWGVRNSIVAEYLGTDKFDRHIFSISAEIGYKEVS